MIAKCGHDHRKEDRDELDIRNPVCVVEHVRTHSEEAITNVVALKDAELRELVGAQLALLANLSNGIAALFDELKRQKLITKLLMDTMKGDVIMAALKDLGKEAGVEFPPGLVEKIREAVGSTGVANGKDKEEAEPKSVGLYV